MNVNEIMKKDVATCTPNDDVATAVTIMHDHKCGFVRSSTAMAWWWAS